MAIVTLANDASHQDRGQPFWLSLAQDCAVPAGESAADLVRDVIALLGSPDPVWRDDAVLATLQQIRR